MEENDAISIHDSPAPNNPEMVIEVPKKVERLYIDPYYAHYVLVRQPLTVDLTVGQDQGGP